MRKLFVFDLDDTLMWNEYTYSLALIEFCQYILKIFERKTPFIGDIAQMVAETSHRMLKEANPATGKPYGFSMERFSDALIRVYKTLCENGWGQYAQEHASFLHLFGTKAFDEKLYLDQGMVPGAKKVLDFLKNKDDELVVLTKGDPRVQVKKIRALDLARWFDKIFVVDDKTKENFRAFIGHNRPAEVIYSVGNSFSSDIRPALDAGCNAIFIPCFTWRAESIDAGQLTESEKKRLIIVKKISEITGIYEVLS